MARATARAPRRRHDRRRMLLGAALRAIRRHGRDVSMDEIAAEARVAKPILYRHLGDKARIYEAVAAWHLERLMAELRKALTEHEEPRRRLEATIDTYLAYIERERAVYRFLVDPGQAALPDGSRVGRFVDQLALEIAGRLREVLADAGIENGAADAWAYGMVGMVELAGDWWLREQGMTRQELVDALVGLLWNGFRGLGGAG